MRRVPPVSAALAAVALLSAFPAQSKESSPIGESGNAFLERCGKEQREPCRAYVSGLVDGIMVAAMATKSDLLCIPPGVTTSQVHDIVADFIRDNPPMRHLRTDELAYQALGKAFPCPTKAKPKKKR
jgi:hypothetical protein